MSIGSNVTSPIPDAFCADAGAIADWCVATLGFVERERSADDDGVVGHIWGFVQRTEVAP